MTGPLGVAVVGAGMVGRAHANAYRQATTVYGAGLPEVVELREIPDYKYRYAVVNDRRVLVDRPALADPVVRPHAVEVDVRLVR